MPEISFGPRVRKSPYFHRTLAAGATHFTVYNRMYLPTSYGDLLGEYEALTQRVTVWDVAAERQVEIRGPDAAGLTQYVVARDLTTCRVGRARYAPVCDHRGVLVNDPVALKLADDHFWLSTADSDLLLWVRAIAGERGADVDVREPDVSPLAVQGPRADDALAGLVGEWVRDLPFFSFRSTTLDGIPLVVCRSGWSKQGGFELFLRDRTRGHDLWDAVWEAARPYGVAAATPHPIERIEGNLLSLGADTDDDADPFELGLGRFVDLDVAHEFVGKAALVARRRSGRRRALVPVRVDGDPIASSTQWWFATRAGRPVGKIVVVAHSPRHGHNLGLALLDIDATAPGTELAVDTEVGPRTAGVLAPTVLD